MEYKLEGKTFIISYQDLREQYLTFCAMTDDDFIKKLPAAIHTAIVICYFKEIPSYICLSDIGIIHELVHLLQFQEETMPRLREIRKMYEQHLLLT